MSKAQGNIKPLFDYVLIKPVKSEEVLSSGIVLPDSVKEKPQVGEIMAVGPGSDCCGDECCGAEEKKSGKMVVKVGQKVLYKKWGGNEVKIEGKEYLFVKEEDILAIVG